jgi:GAF domain-containing protein
VKRGAGTKGTGTRRPKRTASARPAARKASARGGSAADPDKAIARLKRELAEALERQAATSEVLKVVSTSPGELETVFGAILSNATRLCEAKLGVLFLWEGQGRYRVAALHGASPRLAEERRPGTVIRPPPSTGIGRVAVTRRISHVVDVRADRNYVDPPPGYSPAGIVIHANARTELAVPMLKDDELIGTLVIYRQEVRAFTARQIGLVQDFAAQAVIAIGNARLLSELRQRTDDLSEALDQQTATSEVLKVISGSPGDLQPVFGAMLENAVRLCEAKFGILNLYDGDSFRHVALHDVPLAYASVREGTVVRPAPGGMLARIVKTKAPAHVEDVHALQPYRSGNPDARALGDLGGARSMVTVPMLKDGQLVGAIGIYRQQVRPFTDKQIELVKNFAAQAVIAIENARLLGELRQRTDDLAESLEQQTATSEVLKVISSSPGDLVPVFEAMLANAVRISGAKFGAMALREGDAFRAVATYGTSPAFAEERKRTPLFRPTPGHNLDLLVRAKDVVHLPDLSMEAAGPVLYELAGARAMLNTPLLKDGEVVGSLMIYRQEPGRFTDKQIELVRNFAAQAVIAIENTRLLGELRESLAQQTATADVLKVISRSTFDLQAVLDTLVASAARLCRADTTTIRIAKDGVYHNLADFGFTPEHRQEIRSTPLKVDRTSLVGRVVLERRAVHLLDAQADSDPGLAARSRSGNTRSMLGVPLLREGNPIGVLLLQRRVVEPFADKQIELATTFADQAVIAIENARLLSELRQRTDDLSESLEQQTATSEVLKVISRSTGELGPIFDSMLESATRICEAKFGSLVLFEGDSYRRVGLYNVPAAYLEAMAQNPVMPISASLHLKRLTECKQVLHVDDLLKDDPDAGLARFGGARTTIVVPILTENKLFGAISVFRQEVRPFTAKQIELLKNFAAQAVIAIENARLLNELRQRTDDLAESLEQQTATSEVLRVISSSPGELEPVFESLLENATRLCEAQFGALALREGEAFRTVALHNAPQAYADERRRNPLVRAHPKAGLGRMLASKRAVQIADIRTEQPYLDRVPSTLTLADAAGARSLVVVPLLKDNDVIGAIAVYRQEVRPFADKQVELVASFAAQAVIAIENARLLGELRESLQQQTATADVLKVISRSTFDLQTVLDTLTESAERLCEADYAFIFRRDGENYRLAASHGFSSDYKEWMEQQSIAPGSRTLVGRTSLARRAIHIPDVTIDPDYGWAESIKRGNFRTMLGIPLLREGIPIGVIAVCRRYVQPFTEKQIELVSTFADQAVIAIENVRLFDEIQDKSRQLEEASRHKSQFLANMSHELRTPLNAIIGYTELIIDGIYGETPEKALTVLKRVESNGRHLLGLINDVLDFSKIEAGQLKLTLAAYSMRDVVYKVYSAVEPLAAKKNLRFNVEVSPDMPAGHGDEQKLTQVLLNLVGNAIKFTDAGEVAIKAAPANGAFSVAVRDTGPGIDPANQEKLFEEFQQADNSITKAKGGTGLGLAIARRIVELHGGRLWVDSSPGNGSVFTFEVPAVAVPARPS